MRQYYLPERYRCLTIKERELRDSAMRWLAKHHLRHEEIRHLAVRNIDFEQKVIHLLRVGKHINLKINLGYQESPMEEWLGMWPATKSNRFIFPAICFTGRKPDLCRQVSADELVEILQKKPRKALTLTSVSAIMKTAKVNLHINY